MLLEQIAAGAVLLLCALVWLRMALPEARLWRLRAWLRRPWQALRKRRLARTEAAKAIERARRRTPVDRDGNVYRPKSFDRRGRDDDTKLH
jgi:hypothetical protein